MSNRMELMSALDHAVARLPSVVFAHLPSADRVLLAAATLLPRLEKLALTALNTVFSPRLVLCQFAAAMALQGGLAVFAQFVSACQRLLACMTRHGQATLRLMQRMRDATTYAEWRRVAEELDRLEVSVVGINHHRDNLIERLRCTSGSPPVTTTTGDRGVGLGSRRDH